MTHAKAIFFGEHAVVYGYKGITIPLPHMNVEVTLEETDTIQQRDEILSFIADSCGIDNKTKINKNTKGAKVKNKILFGTILALLLVGSVSFADDDADKKRLLEEYDKMQAEKAKEAERLAKENPQATETTEVVGENGEVVVTEGEEVAVAPKKAEKDMTESERMDVEVQRIKKRMLEINDKIENYNKTNEMIDNLEKNVGELERKVNY